MSRLDERLRALSASQLRGVVRGVEKESLRVEADGRLALTPHPLALGSALKHPHITTDFSESQLEFVTGTHPSAQACVDELTAIHRYTYPALAPQMLWVGSMPCELPPDEQIPIGRYGRSNIGQLKHVYRTGLSNRYGRKMQTISGIHYNWSMPGLGDDDYFALIRNFRRHSFVLIRLFGASPAACASFFADRPHELQPMAVDTLYLPQATSLRMGRQGYRSDAQSTVAIDYNSLPRYLDSVRRSLSQPYAAYERLGIHAGGDAYHQLATSVLQIENELYGTIRPKHVTPSGQRPLRVLADQGVQYVEVRCMDLDPFEPVGIAASTMRFLDLFLLHCVLNDSPEEPAEAASVLARNQHETAARGRDPALGLTRVDGRTVGLVDWGRQLIDECEPIAAHLDRLSGGTDYRQAWHQAMQAWALSDALPSARVLGAMREMHEGSYPAFVTSASRATRDLLSAMPLPPEQQMHFDALARESLQEQARVEAADTLSFEAFRRAYLDAAAA